MIHYILIIINQTNNTKDIHCRFDFNAFNNKSDVMKKNSLTKNANKRYEE